MRTKKGYDFNNGEHAWERRRQKRISDWISVGIKMEV